MPKKQASTTRTTIVLPTWIYLACKRQALNKRQTLQEIIAKNLALALKVRGSLPVVTKNVSIEDKIKKKMPKVKYPETYKALKKMANQISNKGNTIKLADLSREKMYDQILKDRGLYDD